MRRSIFRTLRFMVCSDRPRSAGGMPRSLHATDRRGDRPGTFWRRDESWFFPRWEHSRSSASTRRRSALRSSHGDGEVRHRGCSPPRSGSPIYSAGLCSRAASLTPVVPKSANDCCFLFGVSLHLLVTGSAITLVVSRLQSSSLRAYFALMSRPASWLALLSRTFTFELSLAGSPRASVEYNYVDKQSISTAGLSPASPTALWAAALGSTQARPTSRLFRLMAPRPAAPGTP